MRNATRAIARGGWIEQRNRGWPWLLLAEVGLSALLVWRLQPSPTPVPLTHPVVVAAVQALTGAFVSGLFTGREDLYGKSVLRTLHVSPAPGPHILLGLTLAGLPQRSLTSLLGAAVIGWLLPAGELWWTIPVLWMAGLCGSLIGYLASLVSLIGWVRVTPRSLAVLWGIAMMMALNLAIILLGLLTVGVPASTVAAVVQTAAPWLLGGIGGLVAVPAVWVPRAPVRTADSYREAYLNMQELSDAGRRTRASRWPRLLPGVAGALQARLWREIWLNWFTWVRVAFLLLFLGFVIWQRDALIPMVTRFPSVVVLGLGLAGALGSFGELPATLGGSDGPNIGLSLVAGARAGQVVKAKWVAALPLALLSTACTWAISIVLEQPSLVLGLAAGCIGLAFSVIAMTGGLFDLDPHAELTERDVPDLLRAALEQVPRKLGAILGYFCGLLFTVTAVWLCVQWPEVILPLALGFAALAHLTLVLGCHYLKRLGM